MRTILSMMLISSVAFADPPIGPPTDVPLNEGSHTCGVKETDLDARGCAVTLNRGEPAPWQPSVVLDEQEEVRRTRDRARKTGTLNHAEGDVLLSKAAITTIIVGCIVLSATAGAVGGYLAAKK